MLRHLMRRGILVGPMLTLACGQLTSKNSLTDPGASQVKNLGCIQGVVVDGLTGAAIPLTSADAVAGLGIRVLVADTVLTPAPVSDAVALASDLVGHYTLCSIPLDEAYPLQINISGFQKIDGMIRVDSTVNSKSPAAKADIAKQVPTTVVNLALYKIGAQTSDLKFVVTHDGTPQKDAQVILEPTGKNNLTRDNFLIPLGLTPQPMTQTTNDAGEAIFPAATLVLGSELHYRVIPSAADLAKSTATEDVIHVGLLTQAQASEKKQSPYLVYVELHNPQPAFDIDRFSTSAQSGDYNEKGEVSLIFNRDIEIVPGTEEDIMATLNDQANGAVLQRKIPGSARIDGDVTTTSQVTAVISGNRLKLTPIFKVQPNKKTEGGLAVTFSGIYLRPKSSPGTADAHLLKDVEVKVFGAVTPPQIASSLSLAPDIGGDGQNGPANADLARPVTVRVLDQFGNPFKKIQSLTFDTQGNGKVRQIKAQIDQASATLRVDSDADGLAAVIWTLGNSNGPQALLVHADGLAPLTVSARALPVATFINVLSGDGLSATAGSTLSQPVIVQVRDQTQALMIGNTTVHFSALNGSSISRTPGAKTVLDDDLAIGPDSTATVYWTAGDTGTAGGKAQHLQVSAAGAASAIVTVTVFQRPASLYSASGDNFSRGIGDYIDLSVDLFDQENQPYTRDSQPLSFELVTAGLGGFTAVGMSSSSQATPTMQVQTTNGVAQVRFWVTAGAVGTPLSIRVKTGGTTDLVIKGTVASSLAFAKSGEVPTTPVGTDVAYKVQLVDTQGNPTALPGVLITFAVTVSGSGGLHLQATDQPPLTAPMLQVQTGADGSATVLFRAAGAVGTSFAVTATGPTYLGVAGVNFAGTVAAH